MLRRLLDRCCSLALLATVTLGFVSPRETAAVPLFMKQFNKVYITDETDEDYEKLIKKQAKCLVCHQGKSKKNRNPYGNALKELISKKEKDKEKIIEAIKEVGEMHSDPKDEKSPTYNELIAEGKLPGGELDELKKNPEK